MEKSGYISWLVLVTWAGWHLASKGGSLSGRSATRLQPTLLSILRSGQDTYWPEDGVYGAPSFRPAFWTLIVWVTAVQGTRIVAENVRAYVSDS
ncbi:hypothetical protein FA95DRAFT_1555361 [Auriscalpium vulgare]|uniref:Uncharacterized protein n=1 Tax=Auriscalpium vulgare TaxID=40419 RepID=A0ACB8S3J9_9AGAM|nr:hypothetical protein FA95DRAFT_1555361 [Auriscalpium vulgare]